MHCGNALWLARQCVHMHLAVWCWPHQHLNRPRLLQYNPSHCAGTYQSWQCSPDGSFNALVSVSTTAADGTKTTKVRAAGGDWLAGDATRPNSGWHTCGSFPAC